MRLKKIILMFYIVYTVYALMLLGVTTLDISHILPAIIFMWINYSFFILGNMIKLKKPPFLEKHKNISFLLDCKKSTLIILSFIALIFSILVVKYYTGQMPLDVINNLRNNVSVYYQYQNFFSTNQRYMLTFSKIPYVFMLFFINFILFYSYVTLLVIKKNITVHEKIYIIIITIAFVYVGIGRGTSFEFFQLLILLIYVLFSRFGRKGNMHIRFKPIIISIILVSIAINIYLTGIGNRGFVLDFYKVYPDVNFNPEGLLSKLFPFISSLLFRFYDYFGFGFFYVSTYVIDIWFSSIENLIAGSLPFGYQIIENQNIQDIINNMIDIGVRWQPDAIKIVNYVGHIGLLMLCFLMGALIKKTNTTEGRKPIVELTNFMILLQMISLPVGNFVSISSANRLIAFSLSIYWLWKIFINKRITLK